MNTDRHSMLGSLAQNRRAILLGLLVAGWIAGLFTESSSPPAAIMHDVQGLDKVAHFFAFWVLGLLLCALSSQLRPTAVIRLISLPFFLTVLVGAIEEGCQMFVPGRTSSLADLLADVCGALFAILLANRIALYLLGSNRAADASKI